MLPSDVLTFEEKVRMAHSDDVADGVGHCVDLGSISVHANRILEHIPRREGAWISCHTSSVTVGTECPRCGSK